MTIELTKQEQDAIRIFRALANKWPDTLWLFSASGSLHVMKCGKNGEHIHNQDGSVDHNYVVGTVDGISSSGGDW
jgi:hypothetical protein